MQDMSLNPRTTNSDSAPSMQDMSLNPRSTNSYNAPMQSNASPAYSIQNLSPRYTNSDRISARRKRKTIKRHVSL